MPSGPCVLCGDVNYQMSMGGPTVCPSCDCGHAPGTGKLRRELQEANLKVINMYCALDVALGLPSATPEMKAIGERIIESYKRSHPSYRANN